MHADEKAIVEYLKGWPHSFVSGREIARKVGGRERYDDDRGWAIPILAQMVRIGLVESDHLGYFRLKQEAVTKKRPVKHVSPQILKILKSSGKSFESITIDDDASEPTRYLKPPTPPGQDDNKRG